MLISFKYGLLIIVSTLSITFSFVRTPSNFIMADTGGSKKGEKRPWEFGRFFNTVKFYDALTPKIPFISDLFKRASKSDSKLLKPNDLVWSSTSQDLEWGPLDDVVMGGVSKSNLTPGEKFTGQWTGFVTSANNGGFAGIRTKLMKPALDVSGCRGLILRIQGDGNRYKLILRDDEEWNGVAWSLSFDTTADKVTEVRIPFASLIPTRFARTVALTAPFNLKSLTAVQLTLSKFEYDGGLNPKFKEGPFSLNLESIRTF